MNEYWLLSCQFLFTFLAFQFININLQRVVFRLHLLEGSLQLVDLPGHLSDLVAVLEAEPELVLELLLQLGVGPLGVCQQGGEVAVLVRPDVRHHHRAVVRHRPVTQQRNAVTLG